MVENQGLDTGSGDGAASVASASPATAGSSTLSPQKRRRAMPQISPVEALEIFQSAFNGLNDAGIPAQSVKSKDGQVLIYKVAARLCPRCGQPRPSWHFDGNLCKECRQ